MTEPESRKLADLRVVQLRAELEKRGLDKTGVKQILTERLHKALVEEGLDPEVYQFDMTDKKQKAPSASNTLETEEDQNDDTEKESEQSEQKTEDAKEKGTTKDDAKKDAETDEKSSEEKQDQDEKEKSSQDSKEESAIQLTLDEEEVLHDNDAENGDNDDSGATENTTSSDEKKSAKDAPETAKDTPEINPSQQDAKKDEKASGENSEATGNPKIKGISDSQNRNLWITNISQNTRATELKQALSAYGKVIGAKVVINARYPGACCYGYVKMETVEDANNCISKLNNTELNGQIIRIEKVRPEHLNPNLNINKRIDREKSRPKSASLNKNEREDKSKAHSDGKQEKKTEKSSEKKPEEGPKTEGTIAERQALKRAGSADRRSHDRRRRRSRSKDRAERSLSSKSRRREREMVLTFDKIKDERDRERKRERERLLREEKRRREEALRQREIERRQRSESQRLEREREKLRIERERLERERADLMLLERERQKLEREKLELEKLELERVKMRIQEEERRKRPAPYSRDRSYEERKRVPGDRHFDEAPPPPRFDPPPSAKTQQPPPSSNKFKSPNKNHTNLEKGDNFPHKRDRHYENERSHLPQSSPAIQQRPTSQTMVKYNSEVFNFNRERDMRDAPPRGREAPGPSVSKYNSQVPKDSRYAEHERDRSPHFRGNVRDDRERRPMAEHKADMRSSRGDHRYNDAPKDTAGKVSAASETENNNRAAWWTKDIQEQVRIKKMIWKKFQADKTLENYEAYRVQRRVVNSMVATVQEVPWEKYEVKPGEDSKSDQKLFYDAVRSIKTVEEPRMSMVAAEREVPWAKYRVAIGEDGKSNQQYPFYSMMRNAKRREEERKLPAITDTLDPGRFERGTGGSGGVWGHSSQGKVFNSNSANSPQKSWGKDSWRQNESSGGSDRWNSGGSRNGAQLSGGGFSNNSNMMNMGPSCPPPPGINNYVTDRYDYKGSLSYIRK